MYHEQEQQKLLPSPRATDTQTTQNMPENNVIDVAPEDSAKAFEQEFQQQAKVAADTVTPELPDGGSADPAVVDPNAPKPQGSTFGFPQPKPEDKRPLFTLDDEEIKADEGKTPKKVDTFTETERKTLSIMKARDFLQSRLLCYAVAKGQDPELYSYDELMLEELSKAWAHFFEENNIQIPANIDLVVTELYTTGAIVTRAWADGKIVKENKKILAEQPR